MTSLWLYMARRTHEGHCTSICVGAVSNALCEEECPWSFELDEDGDGSMRQKRFALGLDLLGPSKVLSTLVETFPACDSTPEQTGFP